MKILDIDRIFREGAALLDTGHTQATVHVHRVADLVVPSGRLVASDPLALQETPLSQRVPPGCYPVLLCVAEWPPDIHPGETDQRVACAMLRFSEETPVRWELAVPEGREPQGVSDEALAATDPENLLWKYSVDYGLGGFMDSVAAQAALVDFDAYYADFQEDCEAQARSRYRRTWEWCEHVVDGATGANVVAFSTGIGDGCFPSWFGHDAGGKPACLFTDFYLLERTLEVPFDPHITYWRSHELDW